MTLVNLDLEQRLARHLPPAASRTFDQLDSRVIGVLRAYGLHALRIALGIVFIWFGALKVSGRSPVEDLVADTVYWLPADPFVVFLGGWEILVGVGLLIPIALRLTLALFLAQMLGTFLTLVIKPGLAFQDGNPLLLTTEGEFIIKNLVLITAGLAVGSTIRRRRESEKQTLPRTRESHRRDVGA